MLDIKTIRENPEKIKEAALTKGISIDVKKLLELDQARIKLLEERDSLRSEKKFSKKPSVEEIKKIQDAKKRLEEIEKKLAPVETEYQKMMLSIPNPPLKSVRIGKDDKENKTVKVVGTPTKFSFRPKDHIELTEAADLIDLKRGAKVSGARFAYIKGKVAQLEIALINYTFDLLIKEGFLPVFPPVLISEDSMAAMGYLENGGENETYRFEKDGLYLVGTSEQSVGPMHKDEIFVKNELPLRYAAFSSCFRREAGSYGKDTKGILRVHQFDKIEMFSFTAPENSEKEHDFLLSLEERIVSGLGLPYRVVDIVSGDLGAPAAKKWDIEAWLPSQGTYRETHSTSNCTDFQARRLNIKYRDDKGEKFFVHTLNGTAVAIGRMIIAILENNQKEDGKITVPTALQKYLNFKEL